MCFHWRGGSGLRTHTMVAEIVAVVAGEDDDGRFGQFQLVQQVQDAADVAVDTLDRSQVLPGPLLDPRDIDVVVGGLGDLGVQVLERSPVFRSYGQPRGVRCAEVQRNGEDVFL